MKIKDVFKNCLLSFSFILPFILNSCSIYPNSNVAVMDLELKKSFQPWYNSLTNEKWNLDENKKFINYFCNSEQQAIALYSWCSGSFWNEPLHRGYEPNNVFLKLNADKQNAHEIRGSDYLFIEQALNKAIFPKETILYHGVEYMEIEFYEQLKDFIIKTEKGYDYSQVVNKIIKSTGFISTTLNKNYALNFFWLKTTIWMGYWYKRK